MMFDEIKAKAKKSSQETAAKIQKMNEIRKLSSQINGEKAKVQSMYEEIGQKFYEQHKENPPEDYHLEFIGLKTKFANIEELQKQLYDVKGVTICPQCGEEVNATKYFCANCGCRLPAAFEQEEEQPTEAQETAENDVQENEENYSSEEVSPSEENGSPEADVIEVEET